MFFDFTYILIVALPSMIISGLAQAYVRSAYTKWQRTANSWNMTGTEIGMRIVQTSGLRDVRFEGVGGQMSDHYDPSGHIVRMSQDVATQPSVASMAIVAHELGHAQQHEEKSPLIGVRQFLVPAMRFSPMVSYGLIMLGIVFNMTSMLWLGIIFFGITVVFMLITLPVEFDASRRGLKLLEQAGLMSNGGDAGGARQMLTAAAMTYVAAFISSLLTLVYYLMLASRTRSNR
ncbi:MAG: zinc metallopeptidase [Phototrophicales bacterium]|nr:zinc metallopeptidase [Phototrophicales bacterium]